LDPLDQRNVRRLDNDLVEGLDLVWQSQLAWHKIAGLVTFTWRFRLGKMFVK
jgi:hypothetical protein